MRHRNEERVASDETEETYSRQEGGRYIESEERRTKTHLVREVHDWASPDCSRETDETSGVDLMQEERRSNGVGSGMNMDVGNRLNARIQKVEGVSGRVGSGWEWV